MPWPTSSSATSTRRASCRSPSRAAISDTPVSSPEQYCQDSDVVAHFSEGLAVGYRGYDQFGIEPLFPFGYGLSYTSFAYDQLQVEPETSDGTRAVQVRFTVTNTGARAGAEIAQVYLGLPASTGEPPKRLVGWAKVELEPGETREVTVTLDPNATSHPLSYWNVNTQRLGDSERRLPGVRGGLLARHPPHRHLAHSRRGKKGLWKTSELIE